MFDQVKVNQQSIINLLKIPEKETSDFIQKKSGSDSFSMLIEKTINEERIIRDSTNTDQDRISTGKQRVAENIHDERLSNSNNLKENRVSESGNEINNKKVSGNNETDRKEINRKEINERKRNSKDSENKKDIMDQLYNESSLKNLIEIIRSAFSGNKKGVDDNFQKLFGGLKSRSGHNNNSLTVLTSKNDPDKNKKTFIEQLKFFTADFKESVTRELLKISGNRKPGNKFQNLNDKELKEIAIIILNNIRKNKSKEIVKHEVKVAVDDIKIDKKQIFISEQPSKKMVISDDSSHDRNGTRNENSGKDSYNNGSSKTDFFNKNRFDKILNNAKMGDFQENLQDIIDKAKITVRDSRNGSFTIKLNPRELGSVNVNLKMENGVITGKFIVDNEDVKNQLLDNLSHLKYQLEESGISVGEFSVNVNDQRGKYLKQKDEENPVSVSVLNSERDVIAAADQYDSSTVMHNGYINMVI